MTNRVIVTGAPPLGGVALLDPAWDPLIEDSEITISHGIQLLVGQTGQLVGTRSVEDDDPVAWDLPRPHLDAVNGN